MKNVDREIWINGKLARLFGFSWGRDKAIYRIVHDDGSTEYVEMEI